MYKYKCEKSLPEFEILVWLVELIARFLHGSIRDECIF